MKILVTTCTGEILFDLVRSMGCCERPASRGAGFPPATRHLCGAGFQPATPMASLAPRGPKQRSPADDRPLSAGNSRENLAKHTHFGISNRHHHTACQPAPTAKSCTLCEDSCQYQVRFPLAVQEAK